MDFYINPHIKRNINEQIMAKNVVKIQPEGLLPRHPGINAVCGNKPAEVERVLQSRKAHIAKGLPSVLLVAQGKSGSVPVGNILNSGFYLHGYASSLDALQILKGTGFYSLFRNALSRWFGIKERHFSIHTIHYSM